LRESLSRKQKASDERKTNRVDAMLQEPHEHLRLRKRCGHPTPMAAFASQPFTN